MLVASVEVVNRTNADGAKPVDGEEKICLNEMLAQLRHHDSEHKHDDAGQDGDPGADVIVAIEMRSLRAALVKGKRQREANGEEEQAKL